MRSLLIFVFFLSMLALFTGCERTTEYVTQHEVDWDDSERLMGRWQGSAMVSGNLVTWEIFRDKNRRYESYKKIHLKEKEALDRYASERGTWWVKEGKMYYRDPDKRLGSNVYEYEIVSKHRVRFKLIKAGKDRELPVGLILTEERIAY